MARKRTKLGISPGVLIELKERLRTTTDLREKERLQVVLWSTQGRHTLEDLARLASRARSTIQIWLDHFEAGGMARVLRTGKSAWTKQSAGPTPSAAGTGGRFEVWTLAHGGTSGPLAEGSPRD